MEAFVADLGTRDERAVVRFRGLELLVYHSREATNSIVVDIETGCLEKRHTFRETAVPRLRVCINEELSVLQRDGSWKVMGP